MKKKEKRALLRDLLGLFQGANLQNAQVNMFVERGAKVVYQEVAGAGGASGDRSREGATDAAAAGAAVATVLVLLKKQDAGVEETKAIPEEEAENDAILVFAGRDLAHSSIAIYFIYCIITTENKKKFFI